MQIREGHALTFAVGLTCRTARFGRLTVARLRIEDVGLDLRFVDVVGDGHVRRRILHAVARGVV
jgi:hypothetical protein